MKDKEIFRILSDVFDDIDLPMHIYVRITEMRSRLWKKYRINKKEFQEMLQQVHRVGSPYRMQINLSGGPCNAYKKDNWVEVEGKHWILIEIRTPEHERYMAGHRG